MEAAAGLAHQPSSDSLAELQVLLTQLGEGPLNLQICALDAARSIPRSREESPYNGVAGKEGPNDGDDDKRVGAALAAAAAELSVLFAKHVGPFPDVIDNATRVTGWSAADELHYQALGCSVDHSGLMRYKCPMNYTYQGPRTDVWVWVELFLGKGGAEGIRAPYMKDCKEEVEEMMTNNVYNWGMKQSECCESVLHDMYHELKKCKENHCMMRVMANVLRYLRNLADDGTNPKDLLRFASMYGLSGAINDILAGRYGPVGEDLTIDTLLHVPAYKPEHCNAEICFPPYAIAAVLGHVNVVRLAVQECKADIHAPFLLKFKDREQQIAKTAAWVLSWAIQSNQPNVVRCLVVDCGMQFRWLDDCFLEQVLNLLFNYTRHEYNWFRGKQDLGRPVFVGFSMGSSHNLPVSASFKEKESMLKVLVDVGLPVELLLPEQPDLSLDRELIGKAKAEGRKTTGDEQRRYIEWDRSLPRAQQKARNFIFRACSQYNRIAHTVCSSDEYASDDDQSFSDEEHEPTMKRERKDPTRQVFEYYDELMSLWGNQPTEQAARLTEYEEWDPRWTRQQDGTTEYKEAEVLISF